MVINIKFITMNGLSNGSVMWKKLRSFVAPSINAASYMTGFMERSPAVKKRMVNGSISLMGSLLQAGKK